MRPAQAGCWRSTLPGTLPFPLARSKYKETAQPLLAGPNDTKVELRPDTADPAAVLAEAACGVTAAQISEWRQKARGPQAEITTGGGD